MLPSTVSVRRGDVPASSYSSVHCMNFRIFDSSAMAVTSEPASYWPLWSLGDSVTLPSVRSASLVARVVTV